MGLGKTVIIVSVIHNLLTDHLERLRNLGTSLGAGFAVQSMIFVSQTLHFRLADSTIFLQICRSGYHKRRNELTFLIANNQE